MMLARTYEICLYHKDGGSGISLTKDDKGPAPGPLGRGTANNALGAAFGPDARYLWYARHRGGFGYNLSFPQWELAIYDRETGKVFPQTDVYGSAMRPVRSPDGRWLVYATRHDAETGLRLRNLASGDEQWLVYPVQRDDQESRFTRDLMPGSSFTPDSKALVVSYGGKIWRVDVPSGQTSPIPVPARVHQDLGPPVRFDPRVDTGDILVKQIRDAAPSPDGRRLAFSALDKVYVMELPGGVPRRLTSDTVHEQVPTWSPDGQWIAYVTWSDRGGYVEKVRADARGGGKAQRLTPEPAFYDHPVWSPDGQRLVVIKGPRGPRISEQTGPGYELAWLPAAGGPTTRITPIVGGGRPHFSRDPNRIYLYEANEGLVSMRYDGRTVHWSIGRSFFRYAPSVADSLARLKARTDSVRADSLKQATKEKPDSVGKARVDSLAKLPAYEAARVDVTIRVRRDVPRGSVVLRGGRIITMKGDDLIEKGDIVVTDSRFACVAATCPAPAGARIIDVTGKSVIPGLIDIHAHPWPTWGIHETAVWKYLANLAWGVTTTRDPQTSTTDVLTYADQVEAGELIGPRIYHTGPGVFGAYLEENWTSLDDVRNTLKRYSEFYHTNTIKQYMAGNRKQRQWVIMAAQELGLMPTIEGGLDFKMNQTVQLDGYPGSEHSFPIMPLYTDAVPLAAQSGITYTPTLLVSYGGPFSENYFYEHYDIHDNAKIRRFIPHEEIDQRAERRPWFRDNQYVFPRIAASAAAVLRAGGNVRMGCHGQLDGLGCHWELWAMTAGGMTSRECVSAVPASARRLCATSLLDVCA